MTPHPGRHRLRLRPQAKAPELRHGFRAFIAPAIILGLLICMIPVPPRQSVRDLCQTDIERQAAVAAGVGPDPHRADIAPIYVMLVAFGTGILVECMAGKIGSGLAAIRLEMLGRVNPGDADSVLLPLNQQRQRIAIRNADHITIQGLCID